MLIVKGNFKLICKQDKVIGKPRDYKENQADSSYFDKELDLTFESESDEKLDLTGIFDDAFDLSKLTEKINEKDEVI